MLRTLVALGIATTISAPLEAQRYPDVQRDDDEVALAGPRFGVTVATGRLVTLLRDHGVRPVFTQIGWQHEWALKSRSGNGSEILTESVWLIGGGEQHAFLPSLTQLIGWRSAEGRELGLGPNLSLDGVSMAFAGGVTWKTPDFSIPVTFAVVPGADGVRFTMLGGLITRARRRR